MNQRDEQTSPTPNGSSGSSTSTAAVGAKASVGDDPIVKEKKADTDKVEYVEGPEPLTPEEQRKLVEDVNELFEVRLLSSLYAVAVLFLLYIDRLPYLPPFTVDT